MALTLTTFVGYLDMLSYPVLYNLLSMVALGDTRLSEKLVTEIQSRVKHQAENFTKIRAHMKRSQAWAPFRSSLWSSPFTKCEETVLILKFSL